MVCCRRRVALLSVRLAQQALHRHMHHVRVRVVRQRVRKCAAHRGHGPVQVLDLGLRVQAFTLSAKPTRSALRPWTCAGIRFRVWGLDSGFVSRANAQRIAAMDLCRCWG
jgi:hypothetical protein